jgi:DNA-directed RNA polymerase sigma subunit (sigma70/sigma32)
MGEKIKKVRRVAADLSAEGGHEPGAETIAGRLGWEPVEVRQAIEAIPDAISLNGRARQDDDSPELGEFVEDQGLSDAAEEVAWGIGLSGLEEEIRRLPERHRRVLIRRYGLDDQDPDTLQHLAAEYGISRERVRQMQREAEQMLKTGARAKLFRDIVA